MSVSFPKCILFYMLFHAYCCAGREATIVTDGRYLNVNGQDRIPAAIFGAHAIKLSQAIVEELGLNAFRQIYFHPSSRCGALDKDGQVTPLARSIGTMIDCQGDRYCHALVLTDKNYVASFERLGREYAERCRQSGWPGVVEFWNEPYLNWASRSHGSQRNNYHPQFYERAGAAPGVKATIKGWSEPLKYLEWKNIWARDEDGQIAYGVPVPEGLKPGDTFASKHPWYWLKRHQQTFTVVEELHLHDPTQVSYWSGRQNLEFYLWMFEPFAKAVRETNPDVRILAGWDFGYSHRDWAVWRELCEPLLDKYGEYIDGLTEHHYGMHPSIVRSWYELGAAYMQSRHGRWLKTYNTECGGKLDPAVYGLKALEEVQRKDLEAQAAELNYTFQDIVGLLYYSPDKVGARTAHQFHENQAVWQALKLMRDLRGSLLNLRSDSPSLWGVAAQNADKMVLFVYNADNTPCNVNYSLTAPTSSAFEAGTFAWIVADQVSGSLQLVQEETAAQGRIFTTSRTLGGNEALKIVLKLNAEPTAHKTLQRQQYFASEGVLKKIAAGKEEIFTVRLPKMDALENARLRLLWEIPKGNIPRLTINGRVIAIGDTSLHVELELEISHLKPENRIVVANTGENTFQVCAVSILVEHE